MGMKRSPVEIRCVDDGFELVLPAADAETTAAALSAAQEFPLVHENRVLVEQHEHARVDSVDRVQLCIRLAYTLHDAGLENGRRSVEAAVLEREPSGSVSVGFCEAG